MGGDHDGRDPIIPVRERRQQPEAIHHWHAEIGDQEIWNDGFNGLERQLTIGHRVYLSVGVGLLEALHQRHQKQRLVVDDEDSMCGVGRAVHGQPSLQQPCQRPVPRAPNLGFVVKPAT